MFKPASLALLLCVYPASALAQASPTTSVDTLLGCLDTGDPGARLACYDREARAAKRAIAARDVVVLDRAEVRRTRRSLFGFSLPSMKMFGDREGGKSEAISRLETTITSVRRGGGYGLLVMTLAEGGNWQTMEADRDFSPTSGQPIVIKRGPIGNYNANVAGGRAVRVKRVN